MSGKCIRSSLVIAVLLAAATPVLGGGFYIDHFGARGAAMGNTYLGRPTSCTTIFHNPAGLSLLEDSEVRLDARVAFVESEFEPTYGAPDSEEEAGAQLSPFLGYSTTMGDLSLGLGVYSPFGNALEYNDGWGRYQVKDVDLKTIYVTPAASYAVTDNFSIGAGLSYVWASLEQTIHMPNPSGPFELDDVVGTIETTDDSSFGANFGVHYHQGPLFVGASYSYHPDLDLDGDVKLKFMGNTIFEDDVNSVELQLCDTARLGVGYQFCDCFFMQAELDWIGWGEHEELTVDFATEGPPELDPLADMNIAKDWEDTIGFRLGAEYTVVDGFMVRCGYEFDKGAIPMETVDLTVPDGDKHMIAAGFGYHTGPFEIDVAYLHFIIDETTVVDSHHNDPAVPVNFYDGEYSASLDWIHLTLGYCF